MEIEEDPQSRIIESVTTVDPWGAKADYWGDLSIKGLSTDIGGSGGGAPYYAPPPEEEPEAVEPEDTFDVETRDELSISDRPPSLSPVFKSLDLRLLSIDFHLQWVSLIAASASRGSLPRPVWRMRVRASDLDKKLVARAVALTPCEAVVSQVIRN